MKTQPYQPTRTMTGGPQASGDPRTPPNPLAGTMHATAIWLTIAVLGLGPAVAQEAATEPASSPPATIPGEEAPEREPSRLGTPSPPTATEPTTTEPTATEPVATEPATTAPTTAAASTRPATSRPAVPDGPLSLNFREASLRTILEYISEAAGLVIVEDTRIEGRVTVMSQRPVSVDEAVSLLDTVLRQKGYAAIRIGRTLKVVTIDQAKKDLIPVRSGNDPNVIQPSDRMVTQIIPIRYADAIKLKADLAPLIPSIADVTSNASSNTLIVTGTEATIRRIVEIIQAIDVHMSEVAAVKVFQLKYANASSAARLITEIFREDQTGLTALSAFGRGGRAFAMPGVPGGPAGGAGQETGARNVKVTASADDRTNTLVVSASPDVLKVIEGVVKELDANPAEEQAVFVYRLKNGQAKNLESVLNSIFGWTGTSTGGTTAVRQTTGTVGGTRAIGAGSAFGSRTTGAGARGGSSAGAGMTRTGQTGGSARAGTAAPVRPTARGASPMAAAAASNLAGQVYVVADEDTNSLLVTTASKNFDHVQEIIADLDRAVPQVLIKVLIAEVSHDKSIDLGTEFSMLNLRASGTSQKYSTDFSVAAQTGGFVFQLDQKDVTAVFRALASVAKLDVLSRPYILTSDNQQASIMVGQEVPFIINTRTTDTGQTINTIEYDDIGIILNVTPHINPQGLVTLDVYPEISTLTGETVPISETVRAPVFAKRSAQSRVAIRDGHTIVIGGLMEDRFTKSVEKVPLLGDIPGLGLLFQRTVEKKTKTELLIFLTPHVALDPDDLKGMSEDERAGTKVVQDAVEKGALEEHLKGMQRGAASRPAAGVPHPGTSGLVAPPEPAFHVYGGAATSRPAAGEKDEPEP